MANQTFAKRLEKYMQFLVEEFLCNKDRHESLVKNPPITNAVILACSDPRVLPSLTFLSEPGDEFVDQTLGNIFTENTAIAIRTGIMLKDVRLVLVMGHSDCYAMRCCLTPERVDPILGLHSQVAWGAERALKKVQEINPCDRHKKRALKTITQENIIDQVLKARDCINQLSRTAKRPAIAQDTLVVGLYYDLQTGALLVYKDWTKHKPKWLKADRVLEQLR